MKSDSEKLHRRGSSLVNRHDTVELLAEMRENVKNRSSPEIDLAGREEEDEERERKRHGSDTDGRPRTRPHPREERRKQSESDSVGSGRSKDSGQPAANQFLSESTHSRASIQSGVTLVEGEEGGRGGKGEGPDHGEDEEEVVTPLQRSTDVFVPPSPSDSTHTTTAPPPSHPPTTAA